MSFWIAGKCESLRAEDEPIREAVRQESFGLVRLVVRNTPRGMGELGDGTRFMGCDPVFSCGDTTGSHRFALKSAGKCSPSTARCPLGSGLTTEDKTTVVAKEI